MNNKLSISYLILIIAALFFGCHGPVKEENKNNAQASSIPPVHVVGEKYIIDTKETVLTWEGSMVFGFGEKNIGYVYTSKGELIIGFSMTTWRIGEQHSLSQGGETTGNHRHEYTMGTIGSASGFEPVSIIGESGGSRQHPRDGEAGKMGNSERVSEGRQSRKFSARSAKYIVPSEQQGEKERPASHVR